MNRWKEARQTKGEKKRNGRHFILNIWQSIHQDETTELFFLGESNVNRFVITTPKIVLDLIGSK